MAYISHSHIDYRSIRERAIHIQPRLLVRSLVVAAAAAVAVLALSEGHRATQTIESSATTKSDRLAAPAASAAVETARVTTNLATRTTTVQRGFVSGLDPASPMGGEVK